MLSPHVKDKSIFLDYKDCVTGVDLYSHYRAASLRFECDALREQITRILADSMVNDSDLNLSEKVREELTRLGLLSTRREGRVLHLTNDVTVGARASMYGRRK